MVLTVCAPLCFVSANSTQGMSAELLADLDTFESSVVRNNPDETHRLQLKFVLDPPTLRIR